MWRFYVLHEKLVPCGMLNQTHGLKVYMCSVQVLCAPWETGSLGHVKSNTNFLHYKVHIWRCASLVLGHAWIKFCHHVFVETSAGGAVSTDSRLVLIVLRDWNLPNWHDAGHTGVVPDRPALQPPPAGDEQWWGEVTLFTTHQNCQFYWCSIYFTSFSIISIQ